jgi:prepilin-type N-terminal cleavage/methylation domain-containing protein
VSRGWKVAIKRAFTVAELLVVLVIIAILLAIVVPSFQGMIRSSEEALAESLLQSAMKAGREAGLKSSPGRDAAVVFFFEPGSQIGGGRLTAQVYVKSADVTVTEVDQLVDREVFVPAPEFAPIRFPRYWMVRASVGGLSANNDPARWYNNEQGGTYRYVDATNEPGLVNWVFPETGFYNKDDGQAGLYRSTFMVRFQGGTGTMMPTPQTYALIVAPRPSSKDRAGWQQNTGNVQWDPSKAPWQGELDKWVRGIQGLEQIDPVTGYLDDALGRKGGLESSDVVMCRSVSVLALYNERRLAAALGVRVDSQTDTIYRDPGEMFDESPDNVFPKYLSDSIQPRKINLWIEGDTNLDGNQDINTGGDNPEAKLFAIDRYTGSIKRLNVQGDAQ